jgi:hypothetical protein
VKDPRQNEKGAVGLESEAKSAVVVDVAITKVGDPVQLLVVGVDGTDLKLSLYSGSTIMDVKKLIQHKKGVGVADAHLLGEESEQPLNELLTLAKCGLVDGATVFLIVEETGFIPSKHFDGSKPDYQFTTGPRGLGYYKFDNELGIGASHLDFKKRLDALKEKRGY